jgi:hypothetical protein
MKTVFYEMNEVPKRLFDFYADAKPHSAFATLKSKANLFETITADLGHLSPWVTWPTLHRGVSNVDHKISDLGQDLSKVNKEMPSLWQILSDHNLRVGVFGSLQSYPLPHDMENYDFYVPDTFAAGPECFPKKLTEFQRFNLAMVKQNGRNVSKRIAMTEALDFLKVVPGLGLRGSTGLRLAKQLFDERINKDRIVRRRTSQVEIAFDLFRKQLDLKKPDVAFYFTNHVASSMHRYWPTIFPNDYPEGKFDKGWLDQWSKEIPHSITVANRQLDYLIRFSDLNSYRLIVLSSMGQHAVHNVKPLHSQVIITNVDVLMNYLGFSRNEWEPCLGMAPRLVVSMRTDSFWKRLQRLDTLLINNTKIEYKIIGTSDIRFETACVNQVNLLAYQDGQSIDPAIIGIENVNLQDASGSYAYHIPQGILLEYLPGGKSRNSNDSWKSKTVLDVAPSILNDFNIAPPSYMKGERFMFGRD